MFAYCNNEPVNSFDLEGLIPQAVEDKRVHNWVLSHICASNSDLKWNGTAIYYNGCDIFGGFGFCDLYNFYTGEVWELKKNSDSWSCRKENALKQLDKYCEGRLKVNRNLSLTRPYITDISPNTFYKTYDGYDYTISYWSDGDGILRYDYRKVKTQERREMEEAVTVTITTAAVVVVIVYLISVIKIPIPAF